MEEVWKVVELRENGSFGSAVVGPANKYHLKYRLGEVTLPLIGKIFAFKSKEDAVRFLESRPYRKAILRCETSAWRRPLQIAEFTWEDYIYTFWKKKPWYGGQPPRGTIFCDDLRPLEVVAIY